MFVRQGIASPGFEIGSSHHEIAIFPALPIAYSHVPLWTRIHQPVLLFDPEKGKGPRPSEGSGTVPKVCPKISNTIEKYLNPSKSGRPKKRSFYRGNPLFYATSVFPMPPTHGRSQRFKSSIAHQFLFRYFSPAYPTPARVFFLHPRWSLSARLGQRGRTFPGNPP